MTASAFQTTDTIRECTSIRQFKTIPVSEELIGELLSVAASNPHPGRQEPWRFLLFTGEGKSILADAIIRYGVKKRDHDNLMSVPAYLMVVINQSNTLLNSDQDYATTCSLIQNFRMAAWERGLGITWVMKPYLYRQGFLEACGIMPGERLVALLQIGYPEIIPVVPQPTPVQQKWTVIRSTVTSEADGHHDDCIEQTR